MLLVSLFCSSFSFIFLFFLLVFHTSRSCLKGGEKMLCVSLDSKIKYLANASNWSLWILFFSLDLLEFFKMSPDIERNKGVRIRRHRERERIYRDALSLQRCNHLIIQPRYSRGCMMERFSVMMTAFRDFLPII